MNVVLRSACELFKRESAREDIVQGPRFSAALPVRRHGRATARPLAGGEARREMGKAGNASCHDRGAHTPLAKHRGGGVLVRGDDWSA